MSCRVVAAMILILVCLLAQNSVAGVAQPTREGDSPHRLLGSHTRLTTESIPLSLPELPDTDINALASLWVLPSFTMSPNGLRVAHSLLVTENGSLALAVVVDGEMDIPEEGFYEGMPCLPFFSPDSKRLAYAGFRNDRVHAIIDGIPSEGYVNIDAGSFCFSADSRRHAYVANRGNAVFMVIDGQPGPMFQGIVGVDGGCRPFSPDSRRVAYAGVPRLEETIVPGFAQGQGTLFLDGEFGKGYESLGEAIGEPVWSKDSQSVAHWARDGNRNLVVMNGEEQEVPSGVDVDEDLFFSGDLSRVAWIQYGDSWKRVVVNGVKSKKYPEEGNAYIGRTFAFSPDSQHYLYVACLKDGSDRLIVDNEAVHVASDIAMAIWSPDSKRYAFTTRSEKGRQVVLDGIPGTTYERVQSLKFSPDSRRLAYFGLHDGVGTCVVDGTEHGSYELLGSSRSVLDPRDWSSKDFSLDGFASQYKATDRNLIFSNDGSHFAFRADKNGMWFVSFDGEELGPYSRIVRGDRMSFDEEGGLRFFAYNDSTPDKVLWVRAQGL